MTTIQRPGPAGLQYILIIVGIALIGYGGWQWHQHRYPGPAEIRMQVELQYQIEIREAQSAHGFVRSGTHESPARRKLHKKAIHRDIVAAYKQEESEAQKYIFAGAAVLFALAISSLVGKLSFRPGSTR